MAKSENCNPKFNPSAVSSRPAASVSRADMPSTCKELLDSGVISEDEFNAKKKEIPGTIADSSGFFRPLDLSRFQKIKTTSR